MKKLLALVLVLGCTSVYAQKVSTITCMVKEEADGVKANVKVEFLIQDLGSANAQLLTHPQANEDMGAIFVTPEDIGKYSAEMTNLNGQGGDLRVSEDRIRLFGDGDGYTFVDLVLFKNSGYKKGYVRVYGSGDQMYQELNCSVK